MRQLKATVIIVTYNHEPYIAAAIESVLRQKVDFEYEILIRDDASTDRTSNIINEYARNFSFIKPIINLSNNFGTIYSFLDMRDLWCQRPRGDYIFYLEGDDFWTGETKMASQVRYMERDKHVSFTFHKWRHVGANDQWLEVEMPTASRRNFSQEQLLSFQYAWILLGTCCFRNMGVSWPDEVAYSANTDMFLPYVYGQLGDAHFLDDISFLAYRQHQAGMWSGANESQRRHMKLRTSMTMLTLLARHENLAGFKLQLRSRFLPALKNFMDR